jgi:hypothetical protein
MDTRVRAYNVIMDVLRDSTAGSVERMASDVIVGIEAAGLRIVEPLTQEQWDKIMGWVPMRPDGTLREEA